MKTELRLTNTIHPWDKNPRDITRTSLDRLITDIKTFGHYKPLLITADGTIIGGNMRYRALTEIGVGEVECMLVSFVKEEEGYAVEINGEIHRERFFETIEDAMMALALVDNSRGGHYVAEKMLEVMPQFNIDYKAYAVDFFKPEDIATTMTKLIAPDLMQKNFNVVIEAISEEEQQLIIQKLRDEGYKVKERRKK